jgi:hypothetical protein
MSAVVSVSGAVLGFRRTGLPVEHDPLRDTHNTILGFIERRQLRLKRFVGEGHDS